jgi:ankyrin repeat protein
MNNRFLIVFLLLIVSSNLFAQKKNDKLNYALIDAAANGQTDSVIKILKLHPEIDFRDYNNGTALFYATQNEHLDIVKILVYNGANLNYGLDNGFTPLMSACYNGYFDIAEYLASSGAGLDIRDQYWATAVHYAVAMGHYYIVDMLLYYGANAHMLTYEGTSTILEASLFGDTAIAQLLINKDVDIDKENKLGYTPLSVAVQNNDTIMFDFLMANGANPKVLRKKKYPPYAWALLNQNVYAYKKLKPDRFSLQPVANNRYNSLNIAYANDDDELVDELKKEGVTSGWAPYYNAAILQFSASFNGNDAFYNFGFGLQDVKYKTDIVLNYGTRFRNKAILFEESEDTYLQLWEHRRYLELYLQKRFEYKFDFFKLDLYAGLGFQWMFGKYDGIRRELNPSFAMVPQIGLQVDMNPIYFKLGYEYTPYQLYDISGHKVKMGLGYRFNFVKRPTKYSLLWI